MNYSINKKEIVLVLIFVIIVFFLNMVVYAKSYTQYDAKDIIKHIITDKKEIPNDAEVVEKWKEVINAATINNRDPNINNPSEYTKNLKAVSEQLYNFKVDESNTDNSEEDITAKYNKMTKDERMHMSVSEINEYVKINGMPDDKDVANEWSLTLQEANKSGESENLAENGQLDGYYETSKEVTDAATGDGIKYYSPDGEDVSKAQTLDDMISDAEKLKQNGSKISQSDIKNFSNKLYNIFLAVGTVIAVIVGAVLGIQYMLSSVEGKAETKKMLISYAVGCVVVFGSFGIWKITVIILQNI